MIVLTKLQQVKEMISQLVVCWIIVISKTIIAIDLSKQQAIDADPKAIQQTNFTGNLPLGAGATMFFIIEETKETVLDFTL